ncbi:MAG: DUF2911 domain-containing protein [Flavisolibacter sp.]
MKNLLSLIAASVLMFSVQSIYAQGQKPSPPDSVSQKINSGATISINYSKPGLKGRTMGKDVEPMTGKVWRMGANEATVFTTDKEVKVEGKSLPAGKYSLFGINNSNGTFTLIFNKKWNIWGTQYEENKGNDVLKVTVPVTKASNSEERLTYRITPAGKVTMQWGTLVVPFNVK